MSVTTGPLRTHRNTVDGSCVSLVACILRKAIQLHATIPSDLLVIGDASTVPKPDIGGVQHADPTGSASHYGFPNFAMKTVLLLLAFSVAAFAQPSLVAHGAAGSTGIATGASVTLDTSACTTNCMIAVCLAVYGAGNAPMSDNLSNTYTLLQSSQNPSTGQIMRLYASFTPRVSSKHIFMGRGTFLALGAMAFNGIASLHQLNQAHGSGASYSTGSIVPTNAHELILPCTSVGYSGVGAVTSTASPLAVLDYVAWVGNQNQGIGTAYEIQTTATTVNPTWTISNSTNGPTTASIGASFYSTLSPAPLSVTPTTLPEGFKGSAYSFQLSTSGGVQPYTWALTSGTLPAGLILDSSGLLHGTPTQTILATPLTFRTTDSQSAVAMSGTMTLTIAATVLSITTTTCPTGTQYQAYSGCTITATGGTPPYTYSLFNNAGGTSSTNFASLPPGMSLDPSTGAITGSLIGGQGTYGVEFFVTDSQNAPTVSKAISIALNGDNALGGCSLFPSNSIFHYDVSALPIDTSPAAPIPSVYSSAALRLGFGPTGNIPNGIPFIRVPYNQAHIPVATTRFQSYFTSAPIPPYAPTESTSNNASTTYIGDAHVLTLQTAGGGNPCKLYEMWGGYYLGASGWTDYSNAYWDLSSNALTPALMGTSDAAGLPVTPLLLTYDEVAAAIADPVGSPITHPTRFTLNHMLHFYVWPATNGTAGTGQCTPLPPGGFGSRLSQSSPPTSCISSAPAGEIYRLKASTVRPSCAATSPQANEIITAFYNYGIILADNGITGFIIGTPDARWNATDLNCLSQLHLSDFEPVNVSSLMVSPTSGQTLGGRRALLPRPLRQR